MRKRAGAFSAVLDPGHSTVDRPRADPGISGEHAEGSPMKEHDMDLPRCPSCQRGHLLPMSSMNQTFCYWVCSSPICTYVVSTFPEGVKYFKGNALPKPKEQGEKTRTEFEF